MMVLHHVYIPATLALTMVLLPMPPSTVAKFVVSPGVWNTDVDARDSYNAMVRETRRRLRRRNILAVDNEEDEVAEDEDAGIVELLDPPLPAEHRHRLQQATAIQKGQKKKNKKKKKKVVKKSDGVKCNSSSSFKGKKGQILCGTAKKSSQVAGGRKKSDGVKCNSSSSFKGKKGQTLCGAAKKNSQASGGRKKSDGIPDNSASSDAKKANQKKKKKKAPQT
jgi:hypothetical protein